MKPRQQNPDLLSMVGLGTTGGEVRADGSTTETGVHLRWQMGNDLGFPRQGFDLYRRAQNLDLFATCGSVMRSDTGQPLWLPSRAGLTSFIEFHVSGETRAVRGCDQQLPTAPLLIGRQTARIEINESARYVRITFDRRTPPTPTAIAFSRSDQVAVAVDHASAVRQGNEWLLTLFADRIDYVEIAGEDMIICELCVLLVKDGYDFGWDALPLNDPYPIYLPITHPTWGSPHEHSPDDQAEAEARLPANLADAQASYAEGFHRDLHDILYDLVGTSPQVLYNFSETDRRSGATVAWAGLQLLKLTALDPNLARILGLYWHDEPPDPNQYYDYKLVAHYGDAEFLGRRYNYSELTAGHRYGVLFEHEDLRYTSPNPIDVVQSERSGSPMNALSIARSIFNAPLSVTLPYAAACVTIYLSVTNDVKGHGYRGTKELFSDSVSSGEKTLRLCDSNGLDSVILETEGDLTIFEIVLSATMESLNDAVYVSFHHRTNSHESISVPRLEQLQSHALPTGLDEEGNLRENQTSIALRWSLPVAGGEQLRSGAPVLYHVQRANRGNGENSGPADAPVLLNENSPVLVCDSIKGGSETTPQSYYTDRNLPEGWYGYQVRGIDLFGRLGEWSNAETIQTLDIVPPPAPRNVTAQYLDPADPYLSKSDHQWARTTGPGLKVGWEWPGVFRLQAPDVVPPDAEFRIYDVRRELNILTGHVTAVTTHRHTSELVTDLTWSGAADELAGESIRVGANFFVITRNTSGANSIIEVDNLRAPDLAPGVGPFTIVLTGGRSYWTDYAVNTNWDERLHAEPVIETAVVSGRVADVEAFVERHNAAITRPGATHTVKIDQQLVDTGTLTPGALLCDGVVYEAYGHTLGDDHLKVHVVPPLSPTSDDVVLPHRNHDAVYYPGQKYEVFLGGVELLIGEGQSSGVANVAVSCSDGDPHTQDNPVWNSRGSLGNRAGNEGTVSPACKVTATKRTPPDAPGNVPTSSQPIFAAPANYYGQAKYALQWEPVSGASGYAIYRCSGAVLFDHDRVQRQNKKDYYVAGDVFVDDSRFDVWLAAYDPSLTKGELTTNPQSHLDAWRAWADHFYSELTDAEIQQLANRSGNEKAFRRVNKDQVALTSYPDTFDGRGSGFYLYRIRSIDAANNLSAWSSAYPPVHIYDVTPPATPVITSIVGGENCVIIRWAANREKDLKEYHVWRAENADALADVRRLVPVVAITPSADGLEEVWTDSNLTGARDYFYALAAVDLSLNLSPRTATLRARAYDLSSPDPPVWERAEWVRVSGAAEFPFSDPAAATLPAAISLRWLASEPGMFSLVERRIAGAGGWMPITDWIPANDPAAVDDETRRFHWQDLAATTSTAFEYRVRVKDAAGNINRAFSATTVNVPA